MSKEIHGDAPCDVEPTCKVDGQEIDANFGLTGVTMEGVCIGSMVGVSIDGQRDKVRDYNYGLQEIVIRRFEEISNYQDIDHEALQIGLQNIRSAFMWLNQAVYNKPVRLKDEEIPEAIIDDLCRVSSKGASDEDE